MAENEEVNTCVICLEPLTTSIEDHPDGIGVATSCGHVYHVSCWKQWRGSAISRCREGMSVKCPTCNEPSRNFVKLYLDLGSALDNALDDDDSDDEEESNDEGEKRTEDGEEDQEEETKEKSDPPSTPSGGNVIDLSDSPAKAMSPKKDDVQRLKRLKKRYKIKAKRLQEKVSSLEEAYEESNAEVSSLKQNYRLASEGKAQCESLLEQEKRNIEGLKLENVRLNRRLDEAVRARDSMKAELQKTMTALTQLKVKYDRDLNQATAKNMAEVQTILDDHPRLTQEVKMLRESCLRYERILQKENTIDHHSLSAMNNTNNNKRSATDSSVTIGSSTLASKKVREAKTLLRALDAGGQRGCLPQKQGAPASSSSREHDVEDAWGSIAGSSSRPSPEEWTRSVIGLPPRQKVPGASFLQTGSKKPEGTRMQQPRQPPPPTRKRGPLRVNPYITSATSRKAPDPPGVGFLEGLNTRDI